MNYIDMKKKSIQKLEQLKESLVRDIVLPKNPSSESCKFGCYNIKPFGKYSSYVEVLFNCPIKYASFLYQFNGYDIKKQLTEMKFYEDNVLKFYKFSAFVNNASVPELQIKLKEILNTLVDKKSIDIKSIKEKLVKAK